MIIVTAMCHCLLAVYESPLAQQLGQVQLERKVSFMHTCRFDTHVMMGLANGKVKQTAARLALAEEMLKVHYHNS